MPTTFAYGPVRASTSDGPTGLMDGWTALAAAAGIVAVAVVRELLRWRGRRWQKSGPRGTDDPPTRQADPPGDGPA